MHRNGGSCCAEFGLFLEIDRTEGKIEAAASILLGHIHIQQSQFPRFQPKFPWYESLLFPFFPIRVDVLFYELLDDLPQHVMFFGLVEITGYFQVLVHGLVN